MRRPTTWILAIVLVVRRGARPRDQARVVACAGSAWRPAWDRPRLRGAARHSRPAAEFAPAGRVRRRAGRPRRVDRRALLFPVVIKPVFIKTAIAAAFAPKPTTVAVEEAKVEQWPPQLAAIGTLRAYQGVVVAPQVAGVVAAIHFESGDDVAAGAPLVDLDTSVEEADLANGLAQLKNANVTLDRASALIAGGNTPQSTVDAAVAARDSAAAAVDRSRAVIAQKKITAPFAGRLGLRTVDLGQYVAAGANLTTLQRLDPIYVDFSAPEGALANLAVGQETKISVDAQPGQTFTGKVAAIDARVSADSRNVSVRAQFDNPDRKLLPGMFADVMVTTGAPPIGLHPAAHRNRLQPLRRQRLRRRPAPEGRWPWSSSAVRFTSGPDARRAGGDRRWRQGRRQGGDRRSDQAAAEFAGGDRRRRRAAAAGRDAQAVMARQ